MNVPGWNHARVVRVDALSERTRTLYVQVSGYSENLPITILWDEKIQSLLDYLSPRKGRWVWENFKDAELEVFIDNFYLNSGDTYKAITKFRRVKETKKGKNQ